MQSIDHKGLLYVKYDNMDLLETVDYSHIYVGNNVGLKEKFLCLNLIYIGSTTMTQGSNWLKLVYLLMLFIKLDKILLGIYVICVIDCTMIKSVIIHATCTGLEVFFILNSIWVFVYCCCIFIFQAAWALWVILAN